ncbi:MAG: (deoxy)nucleoside triphosphate pyrophosphohydrolase [Clostridia bacterium]|nr:(deoxy)nucleoside triphosphate pyrophosphohydrolase [Clostridia bacterium]
MKPHFNVVGAAIIKDGKVLALRRSDGNESVIHKFEFAGGKVKKGETDKQALIRECWEELELEIEVGELLNTIEYEYSDCTISLSVYFAKPLSEYTIKVHEEDKWLDPADLDPMDWAPADGAFLMILKNGQIKTVDASTPKDFEIIRSISQSVMHEAYDEKTADGQIDYMIDRFLSDESILENIRTKQYVYQIIYYNSEVAGFYAYCPAQQYSPDLQEGTYVSKLYILEFARGKRITSKQLSVLRRPVYMSVKYDDAQTISICKHCGFRIVKSVSTDLGEGYSTDDFLMKLDK